VSPVSSRGILVDASNNPAAAQEKDQSPRVQGRAGKSALALCSRASRRTLKLLTGKKATMSGRITALGRSAGGKFLTMLQCIFRALNIEASAESQAALAIYRKRRKPKNTNTTEP
jgi:hypothetical protein